MSHCDSDDEIPQLSIEALTALKEFYSQQIEKPDDVLSNDEIPSTHLDFQENWQLSQFWYDDQTSIVLAKEAIRISGEGGKVALISCPTLYRWIKEESPDCQVTLFEFDDRFSTYGSDFIKYDYNTPLEIPPGLAASFDIVIADPPFLSEECLTKTSETVKFLAKNKIILCTGAVMQDLSKRLLNLDKAKFEPHHKNNLANEFCCYSNYDMDEHLKLE